MRVIHHQIGDPSPAQATTTRARRARISQTKRGGSTGPPDRSRRVNCGNDEGGQPEWGRRPGPDGGQPPHYAYSSGKHGDSLPMLPGSSRTAAAASQTGPDDLAAELNPHATELNPHKAVPAASRQSRSEAGFPRTGRSPPARQLVRAEPATTSPAVRGARDAQLASLAEHTRAYPPVSSKAVIWLVAVAAQISMFCHGEAGCEIGLRRMR
jgi:hypothetical protein